MEKRPDRASRSASGSNAGRRRTPVQERSRRKVQRLLDAARRLLEREGPEAFNTNRLAAEAGIGIGTLYEYFPDKRAIADHLLERIAEQESTTIREHLARLEGADLGQTIRAMTRLTVRLYRENLELYRALWGFTSRARTEVGLRAGEQQILGEIRTRLEPLADRLAVDDLELAGFMAFHIVESLVFQSVAHGIADRSEDRIIEEISTVVTRYLGLD